MTHSQNHRQETADMLRILGYLLMAGALFVSVRFQLIFAHSLDEKIVAVLYGIGIPLATAAFLRSSIIFKSMLFKSIAVGIFALLFAWEWHGQLSGLLNGTEVNNANSRVALVQDERLKTLDDQLKSLPVVGAVFNDSLDKEINNLEKSLSKCPQGHATVCINPINQQLQQLYDKRDRQGVAAQVKFQRAEILAEKQAVLKGLSGMNAEVENAKVMPVYKGISWGLSALGLNTSPKESEYLFSIIGTFLYTTLASCVWGFRTKMLMEGEFSPALQSNNSQTIPAYSADAVKKSADATVPNQANAQPESWRDRYLRGDASLWSGLKREPSAQPAQTTANADVNIGDFADAINRRNAATKDAINHSERGRSEFREFDDAIIPTEINTTSPTLIEGVGFGAREIPNPNYQAPARPPVIHWPQERSSGAEIGLPEPETEEIPNPAIPEPTRMSTPTPTQTSMESIGRDRGKDTDLEWLAIRETILDGRFFEMSKTVGIGSLRKAPKVLLGTESGIGQDKATRFREYAELEGLPMSRVEWVSRFGDKDLTGEYKNA